MLELNRTELFKSLDEFIKQALSMWEAGLTTPQNQPIPATSSPLQTALSAVSAPRSAKASEGVSFQQQPFAAPVTTPPMSIQQAATIGTPKPLTPVTAITSQSAPSLPGPISATRSLPAEPEIPFTPQPIVTTSPLVSAEQLVPVRRFLAYARQVADSYLIPNYYG